MINISCYHPLTALARYPVGSRKREIVFPMTDCDYMWKDGHLYNEKLSIPCGNCLGCRLEYSRQWAVRCCLEAKQWEHNYFVTLTYNDMFVPLNHHATVDEETGEYIESDVMTLKPDDLKGFIKRLRRRFETALDHQGIRYYACGEYGPLNGRPHYHAILFNCPIPDLVFDCNKNGYTYYRSALLESVWSAEFDGKRVPMGFVSVTSFTFETAAYVARYVMKKHKGKDADYYIEKGILPEFTRCSRRPGIAKAYYDANADTIYDFDQLVVSNGKGKPIKCQPPRYYDRLFDVDNPDEMDIIKDRRQAKSKRARKAELSHTDVTEDVYLGVKENNKLLSIRSLARRL